MAIDDGKVPMRGEVRPSAVGGRRRRRTRWALLLVCGFALALLADSLVPGEAVASGASRPTAPIAWTPCPTDSGYQCGRLPVPIDYQDPGRGSLRLAVIEHPVAHSRGVIVFNPGGPGESGVLILPLLASLMPASVQEQFTMVSFDERGTGSSDPLLCGPSPVAASSAVAGTEAAVRVFSGLERSCSAHYPSLLPTVTTTTSARDMDRLRAALGASRIDFYGLSYGTALGSVYRQLFPSHVRAMVLDGAVDANLSLSTDATAEAPAIENALDHVLTECAAFPGCPLGADPVTFYRDLQQRLSQHPLSPPGDGDSTPVTEGDLATATLLYLSAPSLTPGFFAALTAAADGNGEPLRSMALGLETDLDAKSLVGPLWAITCNDAVAHPDGATTARLARSLAGRYPLGGAEAVSNNLIGCPGWMGSSRAIGHLSLVRAPAPLVIGNTFDPNTPYVSARRLASDIGGRLATYVGYGHTWLLNGSANPCMQAVVSTYLADGVLPVRGTRCPA